MLKTTIKKIVTYITAIILVLQIALFTTTVGLLVMIKPMSQRTPYQMISDNSKNYFARFLVYLVFLHRSDDSMIAGECLCLLTSQFTQENVS